MAEPYDWARDDEALAPLTTGLEDALYHVISEWYCDEDMPGLAVLAERCAKVARPFALAELLYNLDASSS